MNNTIALLKYLEFKIKTTIIQHYNNLIYSYFIKIQKDQINYISI